MSEMAERMFFVIGSPRSGTTLLMRMLNVHPDIYTRPEPHLMTPLAYLGFYDYVDKAPYDQFQSATSTKQFVADLPHGEADYLDAIRAYADTLYGRMLEPTGKRFFLDKTPAYALISPFISKVYPDAAYVVITRHPFAIFSSFAKSFFDDDWRAAYEFNPLVSRYVPAIANFLRDPGADRLYHVKYEDMVAHPEKELRGICEAVRMEYTPEMINYGQKGLETKGLGDPIGVGKDTRPNTKSVHKWARNVAHNPERIEILQSMLNEVTDEDLAVWGWNRESLWEPLAEVDEGLAAKSQKVAKKWDRYHLERRLLVNVRRNIHGSLRGKLFEKMRFYCDVLLRETWGKTAP